jgi:hypothetical protein
MPASFAGAGQIMYSSSATAVSALAAGTAGMYLRSGGAGAPTWQKIDLSSTSEINNNLPITNGGTGASTKAAAFNALSPITTTGDIIYGSAANTSSRLAGNTTTETRVLSQTGDGTISDAPVWSYPSLSYNENYLGSITALAVNTYSGPLASITLSAGTWLITSETTITYSNGGASTYWRATVVLGLGNASGPTTAYTSGEGSTRVQSGGGAGPIQISLSKIVTLAASTTISTFAAANVTASVVITPPNNPSTAGTATGIHAIRIK